MKVAVLSRTKWHLQPSRDQCGKDRLLNGSLYSTVLSLRSFIHTKEHRSKSANTLSPKSSRLEGRAYSLLHNCFKIRRRRVSWERTGWGLEWFYCWQLINFHLTAQGKCLLLLLMPSRQAVVPTGCSGFGPDPSWPAVAREGGQWIGRTTSQRCVRPDTVFLLLPSPSTQPIWRVNHCHLPCQSTSLLENGCAAKESK